MSKEANRLSAATRHYLHGREIDRAKPLKFRLNGRSVHGFAGDTVLSAAMASGLDTAGSRGGEPMALDERFAPPVAPRSLAREPQRALPMERMPASDGLDLATIAPRHIGRSRSGVARQFWRFFGGPVRSLGHRFDDAAALAGPWADAPPSRTIDAALVVVGAGFAGLSAALYAARAGDTVVLIERTQGAGGAARFFGAIEGEDAPDLISTRMLGELLQMPNVTILFRTEAFTILDTTVRAHQVEVGPSGATGLVLDIKARFVILATGAFERLPVFPGNRLPGVSGALAAFQRADRFGVWFGKNAVFNTSVSEAYRLAMMAHDAGVGILKLSDTRLRPQSRFIEFSKAYGIQLATALMPIAVKPRAGAAGVAVSLGGAIEGLDQPPVSTFADQFIVSGGWQPDLGLWHVAGGESRWRAETGRLEASAEVPGVMLAGAAAGYRSNRACLQSGAAAVAKLFLGFEPDVEDLRIDPTYESSDDLTAIAAFDAAASGHSYLDGGFSLTTRPSAAPPKRLSLWPGARKERWPLADQARALSVNDVASGVQLKAIPEDDAGIVAQERCVIAGDLIDSGRLRSPTLPASPAKQIPPYLEGRFGPNAALWTIAADDARSFETGLLVYSNSDKSSPLEAIGVVLGAAPGSREGALILIGAGAAKAGEQVFVKDISRPVPVKLVEASTPP